MIVTIIRPNDTFMLKDVDLIATRTDERSQIHLVLKNRNGNSIDIFPRELLAVYPDDFYDENGNCTWYK